MMRVKDGLRCVVLGPHHKQGHLPCRWLVEVELPPGQVRTALRATLSLHVLAVPGDSLKHKSLLCWRLAQVPHFHVHITCTNTYTTYTNTHIHTHKHIYPCTYTHTKLLESEEVSSKRREGRKEGKEGGKEVKLLKLLYNEYLLCARHCAVLSVLYVIQSSQHSLEVGIFLFPLFR